MDSDGLTTHGAERKDERMDYTKRLLFARDALEVLMREQFRSDRSTESVLDSFHQILRTPAVLALIGLSRTSLWRRVRAGDFPAPVRLGGEGSRAVGWRREDVEQWLAALPTA